MIITIDGQVATGKSSVAQLLAREIGFIYFDTGAMYRCLTYKLMEKKIDYKNKEALVNFLTNFKFEIKINRGNRQYLVSGEDVTDRIRMLDVTSKVSDVAAIPEVRKHLVNIQRNFAIGINSVFEGRDMGTVVFPEAEIKIFLTGSDEVRAVRRFDELKAKFPEDTKSLTLKEVQEQIHQRDTLDMTREISPLKKPEDALVIDTSALSLDEIVDIIIGYKDSRQIPCAS